MKSHLTDAEKTKFEREQVAVQKLRPATGGIILRMAANGSFRYIARYHCPACGGRKHSHSYHTRHQAVAALNAVAASIDLAEASGRKYECAEKEQPSHPTAQAAQTLDDYAATFIDHPERCGARSHAPSHQKNMWQTYNQLIKPYLGRTPLPQLSTTQIAAWHNSLTVSEHRKAVAYNLLHSIMQAACHDPTEPRVTINPVDIPRAGVRRRATERYAATQEEIELFASKVVVHARPKLGARPGDARPVDVRGTQSMRMLFLTTAYCALRREEAICLTRSDVQQDETGIWYINIDKAATRGLDPQTGSTKLIVGKPKSKASKRHVPISPLLKDRLIEYMNQNVGLDQLSLLFPSTIGRMWDDHTIYRVLRKAADEAGLPPQSNPPKRFDMYALRHTGITWYARYSKATLPAIMRFSGQSEIKSAQQYFHADDDQVSKDIALAAQRMSHEGQATAV
ncbi:site-specific integrase [Bifidobacterium sp. ESL0775]|uniref:tyrosine-type recombinase/integrase n=1 Tax=Bifidobacterium sp. ESL0775 TaxID=2983230 RepID=UPI0023F98E19|nr:site-specific integrase [Bifidobacterium sp. ESL0775]WEV68839.1 site-specific integrase [Bifidobacterium sp. ESL0775]